MDESKPIFLKKCLLSVPLLYQKLSFELPSDEVDLNRIVMDLSTLVVFHAEPC